MVTQEDVDRAERHWDKLVRQRNLFDNLGLPVAAASIFWAFFIGPIALLGLPAAAAAWVAKNFSDRRAQEAFALFMKLRDAHIDGV